MYEELACTKFLSFSNMNIYIYKNSKIPSPFIVKKVI